MQRHAGRAAGGAGDLPGVAGDRRATGKADPGNADWQRDLSVSHNNIGDVKFVAGRSAGGAEELPGQSRNRRPSRQVRPRQRRLAARPLRSAGRGSATPNEKSGDGPGALDAWRHALAISAPLAERFPDSVDLRTTPVVHLAGIARTMVKDDTASRAEARALLERALGLLRPLAAAGQLDASRAGWIGWIERELAVISTGGPP